ncbi:MULTISPECIES: HAL/PAL/TAL family ammonia-lyase [unclassified Rhizobium]|uniref:HAL/PAL/TAL family ammonia-lyase n=1 Tax=unclassified Rhizobium TaxID=2613769 RepID=UPI000BDDB604|nr:MULTISPECIES: histidine ammonia-lyase [unclassified Rhizobium]MDH7809608.1 histidine ammonia-lyase [Rhizobium sp. AN67]MDQ4408613.1 histidine ammonia-lyase [Rhizobium sp. AN63]SOD50615.1 histidine ammonia-lyase [Rhizobium sp. AN6A]
MTDPVVIDHPLSWRQIAAVASGADIALSQNARDRICYARGLVEAIVEKGIRGYGINTGVGALCDVIIDRADQQTLSRNIIMSHACGVGEPLGRVETRAVMATMVNNFALGKSGVRIELVELLCTMLIQDCIPVVRSKGSVGYLTHAAAVALVIIGGGLVLYRGKKLNGAAALAEIGWQPLVLEAKEGLSLINGTACSTGIACVALDRANRLAGWADAAASMTYENLGNQAGTFEMETLSMRQSWGLQEVGARLRFYLNGSPILAEMAGRRTQDPLSLRAIPQIHGAVVDQLEDIGRVINRELSSITDNPAVTGTPDAPLVHSQAHAVGAAVALSMDGLSTAAAMLGAISERRIDRLINPLVSGLPAFLTGDNGKCTGFQVVQLTAAALAGDNRRLSAPASLDGGVTAALQEDILTHSTPAALKSLTILENLETILGIELLAATQAYDLQGNGKQPAIETSKLRQMIRAEIPFYADDRPIGDDIEAMKDLMQRDLEPF